MGDMMMSDKPRAIRVPHLLNLALVEAQAINSKEAWEAFSILSHKALCDVKPRWRTAHVALRGFGGGASYRG